MRQHISFIIKQRTGRQIFGFSENAFTLIELILVILLVGVMMMLVGFASSTFSYWKEEAFVRKLVDTIEFLHGQAIADQTFYRLELDFGKGKQGGFFASGVVKEDVDAAINTQGVASEDIGLVSTELYFFLHPSTSQTDAYTVIPPPSFPSLSEPTYYPSDVKLVRVRTAQEIMSQDNYQKAFLFFSPRGFSDFAVIHFSLTNHAPLTILVNPFTGLAQIYREYKDFQWTYTKNKKDREQ